jgi:hypothetical protein
MFYKKSIITFLFILLSVLCQAQLKESKADKLLFFDSIFSAKKSNGFSEKSKALKLSKSGNSYDFMELRASLGSLNSMIFETNDKHLIDFQKNSIDNIINSSKYSYLIADNKGFNDFYKGWISLTKDKCYHEEVILYEGYSFFYITEFLFYLKKSGWINRSSQNKEWWKKKVSFIEEHIWNKWSVRSLKARGNRYSIFLSSRTHKTSHWAGIALYLSRMSSKIKIKKECQILVNQFDLLLKRNLKKNPKIASAYIWNSTFDLVKNTNAKTAKSSIIQDVSHANHLVSYIVAAYETGNKNWTIKEINTLCSTLKNVVYNKQKNTFYDNVDGTYDKLRPGWGNFQADGWVKLSKYDEEVKNIFFVFSKEIKKMEKYNQELQLKANLRTWGNLKN